jgi:chromosome segregation ATPase
MKLKKKEEKKEDPPAAAPAQAKEERGEKAQPLAMRLDQLEAQVTALTSFREVYDARFTTLSEKIGEIRSMVLTQAKDNAELKAKAEKALMSIEGIKPEEFRAAIMRRDAEIEGIKTKMSALEDMIKNLMNEMKEFRSTIAQFKGMEAILGMTDEARKNMVRIQQVRDQVEIMSDKVMAAFLEFQRGFRDVTNLSLRLTTLEEAVKPLEKTVSQMDVAVKQAVTRAELAKLTGDLETLKRLAQEIKEHYERLSSRKEALEALREEQRRELKRLDAKYRKELSRINAKLRVLERVSSRVLNLLLSAK